MEYDGRAGNYRMISRNVVAAIRQMREQLRFFGALLNWAGYPSATLHVQHDGRHEGRSTYTLVKLWRLAWQTIIAYSDKPLRLAVRFGFLISLLAFCSGLYILVHAVLYGSEIVGWASLIVSIYFIGGIIIAILGMLGIYLGKTYDETKKRPLYIVMHATFHGGRKAD
jgi:dolichol-phosphate mannosyltransferase